MYRLGLSSFTTDLADAIRKFEGSCPSPASCRNFNPGNLRAGPGSIGTDPRGFAIFPDYATGEAALERQVNLNIGRGLSLEEFFGGKPGVYPGYAPAGDRNDPSNYARTVAGWLGIDPNTPLASISGPEGSIGRAESAFWDVSDGSGAELSGLAIAGLVLAGLGVAWAAMSA